MREKYFNINLIIGKNSILHSLYSRLEKVPYQTTIKTTSIIFIMILSTVITNAQFTAGQLLQESGNTDIQVLSRSKPTFADIDDDGDLDLYVGEQGGKINVFTNTNGIFTAATNLQEGTSAIDVGFYSSPIFADIDSDDDLDLYVGAQDGTIKVFTNTNGVFTTNSDLQAGGISIDVGFYSSPTFADIDNDGDLDLYVGENSGKIKVFTNVNGVFTATADLQSGTTTIDLVGYSSPTFADIDGDSDLDLFVGNTSGTVKVFTNVNGVFTAAADLQAGFTTIDIGSYSTPIFSDVDNNGNLDLYVGNTVGVVNFFESTAAAVVLVSSISVQGAGNVSTITTQGGTLQMIATVLPANADDTTYTWSVTSETGSAIIDTNGLLTATSDGTVIVKALANDGSGTEGTKTIKISNQTVGINDLAFENLSIFPNPTSGIINLHVSEKLSAIKIMDLTGKTIKVFNVEQRQLDISEFTSGIYFLEIANAEKKSVVKIVKR